MWGAIKWASCPRQQNCLHRDGVGGVVFIEERKLLADILFPALAVFILPNLPQCGMEVPGAVRAPALTGWRYRVYLPLSAGPASSVAIFSRCWELVTRLSSVPRQAWPRQHESGVWGLAQLPTRRFAQLVLAVNAGVKVAVTTENKSDRNGEGVAR